MVRSCQVPLCANLHAPLPERETSCGWPGVGLGHLGVVLHCGQHAGVPAFYLGPSRELRGALFRGAIGLGIGQFREHDLDEAFSFPIVPRGDWSIAIRAQADALAGIAEGEGFLQGPLSVITRLTVTQRPL